MDLSDSYAYVHTAAVTITEVICVLTERWLSALNNFIFKFEPDPTRQSLTSLSLFQGRPLGWPETVWLKSVAARGEGLVGERGACRGRGGGVKGRRVEGEGASEGGLKGRGRVGGKELGEEGGLKGGLTGRGGGERGAQLEALVGLWEWHPPSAKVMDPTWEEENHFLQGRVQNIGQFPIGQCWDWPDCVGVMDQNMQTHSLGVSHHVAWRTRTHGIASHNF